MSVSDLLQGKVARLVTDKGYGFVQGEDGVERFFHYSALQGVKFEQLREGDRVELEDEFSPKGPRASLVRKL